MEMKTLKGTPLSPGLVKGIINLYANEEASGVPHYSISPEQVPNELSRFAEGMEKTRETIRELIRMSERSADTKSTEILNVHLMILDDPDLGNKIKHLIEENKINAEHAVNDVFEDYVKLYEKKQVHFGELVHDMLDIKNRILGSFSNISGHFVCPVGEREPVIVASRRLTPYMVMNIPKENVLAFITSEGGYTTHSTILARSMNVPVIFGIDVENELKCTDEAIVDAFAGKVIVHPDKKTGEYYDNKIKEHNRRKAFCDVKKSLTSRTGSNVRVNLKLNISIPSEMELIKDFNHDGIGLLRTEFLFLEKENPPSEEEQYNEYKSILDKASGKAVTVRLLDIGSDKMPLFINLPDQVNPDLEIKGARAVELLKDIYISQMKAILRAGSHGNLRILYPMVSDISDIYIFREILNEAKNILKVERKLFSPGMKEGIMIETPAAALMAELLLEEVDFANIGSNDLLQYTLAASRGNPVVENRYHILHPSMLKLFEMIIKAGRLKGKEVCLCGEVGSFEEYYPLLLQLGMRSFSVAVSKFPYIKCELLHLRVPRNPSLINKVYSAKTKSGLDNLLKRFKGH